MKKKYLNTLISMFIFIPSSLFAIDCAQLNSDQKIKAYIQAAKELLPIHRTEVSAMLNISPCEKQECMKQTFFAMH